MAKRLFDILFAITVLVLASPFMLLAAMGIKIMSPGPVFYRARRVGKDMRVFDMLKFRSMHDGSDKGSAITGRSDSRVFPLGALLRKTKIDELPQFLNVLKGDMSIVGPRPEDPGIVEKSYMPWMKETLAVAPGITSPGAIYYYAYGLELLGEEDIEESYIDRLLAPKLALDRAYLERANFLSDLYYTVLTFLAVVGNVTGHRVPPAKTDMEAAKKWAAIPAQKAAP